LVGRNAIAFLAAVTMSVIGVVPAQAASDELSTYIVGAPKASILEAAVGQVAEDRSEVLPELSQAIVQLTAAEAKSLDATPGVTVAPDAFLSITDAQDAAPWHLDRLDQKKPSISSGSTPGQYWYPASAGAGVRIYVVDTGVRADHPDLAGRVLDGYDFINNVGGQTTDCNGHGTAVASAAAGTVYGAAKLSSIVPVQVANCSGQASTSTIIRGLDWIVANNPAGTPATVNISLGSLDKDANPAFAALEDAVTSTVSSGFFVAIAAGNDANASTVPEACQFSPARTPSAFTVGASDAWVDSVGVEGRANFSNAGTCLDAFAPGVNIMTASASGADGYRNGTSFASPIVAGLGAIHLGANITATPKQTTDALLAAAQPGALADKSSRVLGSTVHYAGSNYPTTVTTASPNLMVGTPAAVPDQSRVIADLRSTSRTVTSLTFEWTKAATATRLLIEGQTLPKTYFDVSGTSHTFTGLVDGETYNVSAATLNDGLVGVSSPIVKAATGPVGRVTPGPVTNMSTTLIPATSTVGPRARITWSLPSDTGQAPITDYFIQYSKNGSGFTTYNSGNSTSRSFTTPDLNMSTAYTFRVFAYNSRGTGPGAVNTYATSRERPSAVQALTVTAVPATKTTGPRVNLGWSLPSDTGFTQVNDYIIQYSKNGGGFTTLNSGNSANRSFTTPALNASTKYAFRVFAVNSRGTGPANVVDYTTTRDRPSAVTALKAQMVPADGKVTLSWSLPSDTGFTQVNDYIIQYSKNGGGFTTLNSGNSANRSFTTPALNASTKYAFRVFAVNSWGTGPGAIVTVAVP
jgi:subtilisin family serine protease